MEEMMRDSRRLIHLALVFAFTFAWVTLFSAFAFGQKDDFGKPDTCRIVVVQDEKSNQAVAHVSVFNDQELAAMTLPFLYGDGKSLVRCDSIKFWNTRSQFFELQTQSIDTVRQAVLIGLIADMTGTKPPLEKGDGDVARIYFTLPSKRKFQDFVMDSTWYRPMNHLKFVTPDVKGIYPVLDNSKALIKGGIPIPPPQEKEPEKKAEAAADTAAAKKN
jgi:hypothetical protein